MTLHPSITREYARLRALGWTANSALRSARVLHDFEQAESNGLVRLRETPDEFPDLSWLDQTDEQMGRGFERNAKEQRERAELVGVWGVVTERRCPACGEWRVADSCWGFIGDDWRDSGYDTDLMQAALEA